jgi:hypothetical protein
MEEFDWRLRCTWCFGFVRFNRGNGENTILDAVRKRKSGAGISNANAQSRGQHTKRRRADAYPFAIRDHRRQLRRCHLWLKSEKERLVIPAGLNSIHIAMQRRMT